jgi:hypothetical protein
MIITGAMTGSARQIRARLTEIHRTGIVGCDCLKFIATRASARLTRDPSAFDHLSGLKTRNGV